MARLILLVLPLITSLILLSFPVHAQSAPVLLFSDMTDAPTSGWENSPTKGAAVSIWGRNLGASRGSSTITVCGVTLNQDSDFAEWGATTNPTVPLGMQRITFWLRSDMQTGPGTISVTTADGTSNAIQFYCRPLGTNRIYFFSASGSDSNSGLTVSAPKRTPGWFRANAQAGDTAYFRSVGGDYRTPDTDGVRTDAFIMFSAYTATNNGSPGSTINIASYPGETANWVTDNNPNGEFIYGIRFHGISNIAYWTFSKIKIYALASAVDYRVFSETTVTSNFRFVNMDVSAPDESSCAYCGMGFAMASAAGASHLYWLGNYIHDLGSANCVSNTRHYPIYLQGYGSTDYVYIGYNEMGPFPNTGQGSRTLQIYGHLSTDTIDHVYIFGNYFHDTTRQTVILGNGDGSPVAFVRNLYFWNNIVANPPSEENTVVIGGGAVDQTIANMKIYNNVFYSPIGAEIFWIYCDPTVHFKNNIIQGSGSEHYLITAFAPGGGCPLDSSRFSGDHNLYYNQPRTQYPGAILNETSTLTNNNPLFISTAPTTSSDFYIQSGSPARDAGVDTTATIPSSQTAGLNILGTDRDFLGNPRPQGPAYDIGPLEYLSGYTPPVYICPDGTCNGAETCSSCPQDCPTLGGQVCCSGVLYTGNCCSSGNCVSPQVCTNHACAQPPPQPFCGDSACNENENCSTCPGDCGSCPPVQQNQTLCDGLVLLLHFDSSSDLQDKSPLHNDASCSGASCPTWTANGKFGGAFKFDGTQDYLSVSHQQSLNLETAGTLIAWINETTHNGWAGIIHKGIQPDSSDEAYQLMLVSFAWPDASLYDANHNRIENYGSPSLNQNTWYMMASTWNMNQLSLFVDGQLRGSSNFQGPISTSSGNLIIGSQFPSGTANRFNGMIDEIAIFNRTLSAQEIQSLYSSSQPISCTQYHRADTNQNGCVSDLELFAFIDLWYKDSSNPTLRELMEAIGLWKRGGC